MGRPIIYMFSPDHVTYGGGLRCQFRERSGLSALRLSLLDEVLSEASWSFSFLVAQVPISRELHHLLPAHLPSVLVPFGLD